MFCHKCGKSIPVDASFCPVCGAKVFNDTGSVSVKETNGKTTEKIEDSKIDYFYSVPTAKFVFLTLITFGLYLFYWFGKNWSYIKEQEKKNISPVLRSIFSIFFVSDLGSRVLKAAKRNGYDRQYDPTILAIVYFLLAFAYKLPGIWWFLGFLNFLPLLPIVSAIEFTNQKCSNQKAKEDVNYGVGEIIFAVLGGIVWILVLIGSLTA